MDPTVPPGAAILLDFMREIETGRRDATAYDTLYGHNERHLPKPLTRMTLDEVIAAGAGWTRAYKSSAAGAYQFMRATLQGLKSELGLRGSQIFDNGLQDRLGYHLLKRRGYAEAVAGRITLEEFGKRLAMEWASMPVLAATKGAHRTLQRGQSYYAGDALNKSLVPAATFEAVIAKALATARAVPPAVPEVPVISSAPASAASGLAPLIAALVAALVGLLAALGTNIKEYLP